MIRLDTSGSSFPILLRVFGEYPLENLDLIPPELWRNIYILTTNNYRDLSQLKERFGKQLICSEFSNEMAVRNSGAFLNNGISTVKTDKHDQILLIASGYEMWIGTIIRTINKAINQFEDPDLIYLLLPGIHYEGKFPVGEFDIISDVGSIFPSESLAWLNLNSFTFFDTELSEKGALGFTDDGIPLGGIELMITIMRNFANNGLSSRMIGIVSSILRSNHEKGFLDEFGRDKLIIPESVEATPSDIKLERRVLTIEAARNRLAIDLEDFPLIFENLCIVGEYDLSEPQLEN